MGYTEHTVPSKKKLNFTVKKKRVCDYMSDKTNIDSFASKIMHELTSFSDEKMKKLKSEIDKAANEAVEELKQKSPKRSGYYRKGWRKKVAFESSDDFREVVHNATAYQLTHLLEYGHVGRDGKRTKPIPHIAAAEQRAIERVVKALEDD